MFFYFRIVLSFVVTVYSLIVMIGVHSGDPSISEKNVLLMNILFIANFLLTMLNAKIIPVWTDGGMEDYHTGWHLKKKKWGPIRKVFKLVIALQLFVNVSFVASSFLVYL